MDELASVADTVMSHFFDDMGPADLLQEIMAGDMKSETAHMHNAMRLIVRGFQAPHISVRVSSAPPHMLPHRQTCPCVEAAKSVCP
jgi:hypothetical protein